MIANDTDVDSGDILSLTTVSTPGTGTVSINSDGFSVDYTPSADFNGTEVITYTVTDGIDTATGTLTVTVTPVNDAPIAIEDIASVLENATMTSTDVISNDIDVDGDILFLISCLEIIKADLRSRFKHTLVIHESDLPHGLEQTRALPPQHFLPGLVLTKSTRTVER